jgi:hypothetical protein
MPPTRPAQADGGTGDFWNAGELGAGPNGMVGHPALHIRMPVSDPEHANTLAKKTSFDPFSDWEFRFD